MDRAKCRSCNAPILWVVMEGTNRRAPLDDEPSDNGNVEITASGEARSLSKDGAAAARAAGKPLRLNHFASCPTREQHRKTA